MHRDIICRSRFNIFYRYNKVLKTIVQRRAAQTNTTTKQKTKLNKTEITKTKYHYNIEKTQRKPNAKTKSARGKQKVDLLS